MRILGIDSGLRVTDLDSGITCLSKFACTETRYEVW